MGVGGQARGVRTAVPAAAAVLVALTGHLAGGGTMVSPLAVVALAAGATALAHALSARRWSPRTLTALVLLTQAVVHLGCGLAPHHAMDGTGHGATPAAAAGPAMVVAHLAATAVTVAALAHGETLLAVVRHLLGLLGRAGRTVTITVLAVPSPPSAARPVRLDLPSRGRAHARRGGLRGPPVGATAHQP